MNSGDSGAIAPEVADSSGSASNPRLATAMWKQAVERIPRKARLPLLAGGAVLITLLAYTSLSGGPAVLNVVCRHNFRSAELSILIDGKVSYAGEIFGSEKKRLRIGILGKQVEGSFSKSLHVPYGEHVVQVHLTSDGFDQTKRYGVNLSRGRDATLVITAQRGGLSLAYQGAPIAPSKEDSNYFDSMRSVLVTVLGSIVSASVGFVVQEFLRSKKAA